MRFAAYLIGIVLLSCVGVSHAQQTVEGKYTGTRAGEKRPVGLSLEITSAQNGKVQGSVTLTQQRCGGIFPVEGAYQDNKIELRAAAGGRTGDCGERKLELVASGNELTGRMLGDSGEWREVKLSK